MANFSILPFLGLLAFLSARSVSAAPLADVRAQPPPQQAQRVPVAAIPVLIHRVKYGETCHSIATEIASTVADLQALNPCANCGAALKAGSTLRLPHTWVTDRQQFADAVVHLVQPGDVCQALAYKYSISVDDLLQLNPVVNGGCTNLQLKMPLRVGVKAPEPVDFVAPRPRPIMVIGESKPVAPPCPRVAVGCSKAASCNRVQPCGGSMTPRPPSVRPDPQHRPKPARPVVVIGCGGSSRSSCAGGVPPNDPATRPAPAVRQVPAQQLPPGVPAQRFRPGPPSQYPTMIQPERYRPATGRADQPWLEAHH